MAEDKATSQDEAPEAEPKKTDDVQPGKRQAKVAEYARAAQASQQAKGGKKSAGPKEETVQEASESSAALTAQLAAAEAKAEENWNLALRTRAEMDNIRKRAERDVAHAHKYGLDKFAQALLPIMDSLQQALQTESAGESEGSMREGISLTAKMFDEVLEKFNVYAIDPTGLAFDPEMHEALSMQQTVDAAPGTVLVVIQRGYRLNDRLLRPARVIVAQAPSGNGDDNA